MYYLSHFCCCCLKDRENLTNINSLDTDDVSFKDKFTFCKLETIDEDVAQLLCQKCCKSLQFMYQFKRAYLGRQKYLKNYITKLKSTNFSNIYSTLQVSVLNVDPFISIYQNHDSGIYNIIKEEPAIDDESDKIRKISNLDKNDEIHIKNSQASEDSFTDNNNYEIVKINKNDETHIKNEEIDKKLELETINNDKYEIVNNGDNVLKIVRKKDDASLKITLRRSSLKDESNIQPNLTCIFCDRSFIDNKLLREHEKGHNQQFNKCKICSKIMYNKYTYRNHFGRHFGVYKFKCNICNKGLSSKQSLMNHKLKHYGNRMKLKNDKQTNDKSVTAEKDGITPESAEEDQVTLENNSDRHKVNTPIKINIKRNKIISNTAVRKRGRPKLGQRRMRLYNCAMCERSLPSAQKLFIHFKVMHNYCI